MKRDDYLKRIKFRGDIAADENTLTALHKCHVFNVPFENLDIRYHRIFDLDTENIYNKVVVNRRGGFCYELNSLFNTLLRDIGFKSKTVSSRIVNDQGVVGPEYDHMSVLVEINHIQYLADVGFGDLFVTPLLIEGGIQRDGRNLFNIEKHGDNEFLLRMSHDGTTFQKKYLFRVDETPVDMFRESCLDKQTNPASYFVKNTICTIPTASGRLTVFNNRLIEKQGGDRTEKLIETEESLREILKKRFGVVIQ